MCVFATSTGIREVRERPLTAELFVVCYEDIVNGTITLADQSKYTLEGSLDGLLEVNNIVHH